MSYEERIIDLTNAKTTHGSGSFVGCCPVHDDKSPSLSITFREYSAPLLHCFSGCDFEEIKNYFIDQNAWPQREKKELSQKIRDLLNNTWKEALSLSLETFGGKYLENRGLKINNELNLSQLRFHPALYYKNESNEISNHPAIIGLVRSEGVAIGIQRIYINENFRKLDQPKILGKFLGGYVEIGGRCTDTMHLAEGIETALAVSLALDQPVCSAVSAPNLSKVTPPKTVKTIHIWVDKDKSKTGENEATKAAQKFVQEGFVCILHVPEFKIPKEKKSFDYLDVYNIDPNLIVNEFKTKGVFNYSILPISTPNYNLPLLTEEYLPHSIREWTLKHAERINVSPELIVIPLLSVISALIGRNLSIRPKRQDHWTVYSNLWGILIAPPGTKKTPALNATLKILNIIESEISADEKLKIDAQKADITVIEFNIKDLNRKLKEATQKGSSVEEKKIIAHDIASEEAKLANMKINKKRFSTNSYTIEKLIEMIVENPNGMLVYRDELSAVFSLFKKMGHETDRQFFLEGWNGDGNFKYDTLSRGEKSIEGLCITLLGGTQPSVVKQILLEMKEGMNHDGFIQRFQLIAYPNQTLPARFTDKNVSFELDQQVTTLLRKIAKLDPLRHGLLDNRSSNIPFTKLDNGSYDLFSSYMDIFERDLQKLEDSPYKNHVSKFPKLFASLILIFHVINNIETESKNHSANVESVEMAIRWIELQKAHAKKLYDIDYNLQSIAGFSLAKKIVNGEVSDGATLRSIYHSGWSNLNTSSQVESAALFLEKYRWLTIHEKKASSGGRPSLCLKYHKDLMTFIDQKMWMAGQPPLDEINPETDN